MNALHSGATSRSIDRFVFVQTTLRASEHAHPELYGAILSQIFQTALNVSNRPIANFELR